MAINTRIMMGAEKCAVLAVVKKATVCSNAHGTRIKSSGSLGENLCAFFFLWRRPLCC